MKWPPKILPATIQDGRIDPNDHHFNKLKERLVVAWHGKVGKPTRKTVPPVYVYFSAIREDGSIDEKPRFAIETVVSYLDIFRLGSVWEHYACIGCLEFEQAEFDVNFDDDGWTHITIADALVRNEAWAKEFVQHYPLKYRRDTTEILRFQTRQGPRLFIPCLEFFSTMYGSSSELRRILVTYSWEEAVARLFSEMPDDYEHDGTWVVPLGPDLTRHDAKILAHIRYNPKTLRIVKSIYSQLQKAWVDAKKSGYEARRHSLKIRPWWEGQAKLLVEGFWLDGGQDFIGLRIEGCSLPGPAVKVIFPERSQPDGAKQEEEGGDGNTPQTEIEGRVSVRKSKTNRLTQENAPDHSGSKQFVDLRALTILEDPAPIIPVRRIKAEPSATKRTVKLAVEEEETVLSPEEPYGNGKNVGKAILVTKMEMESEGVLRDMWNLAIKLCQTCPGIISVHWYDVVLGTFKEGEPELIQVEPDQSVFDSSDPKVRRWPYLEDGEKRGFLVMRVRTSVGTAYIIEIQRRIIGAQRTSTNKRSQMEESLKGLVFQLKDESEIHYWIRRFAKAICREKGRMDKVTHLCPGKALSFKHRKSKDEPDLCKPAFKLALRKVGIKLVEPKEPKE